MLSKGELGGVRILKPETVELMSRNHLPKEVLPIRLGPLTIPNMGFGCTSTLPSARKWAKESRKVRWASTGGAARPARSSSSPPKIT